MTTKVTQQDIAKLNTLLNDTLQQAEKDQLISCVRILGTAVASLKIKYQVNEENFQDDFKNMVADMQQTDDMDESKSELVNQVLSKSIVECATAIAVAKNISDNSSKG
ncbi:MAG: hypothetical protein QM479_02790 [Pseudomonadota bacterium]